MKHEARFVLGILAALLVLVQGFGNDALGQKRKPVRPRGGITQRSIDYSRFSHSTKQHQESCKSCHSAPTPNWQKVRAFPDVADYPDHDSCVRCHRPQFFKGAQPPICSVCHTKVSPRHDARYLFPNPRRPEQFKIEFPHDKHQDVIASWRIKSRLPGSFGSSVVKSAHAVTEDKSYNNCTICHGPATKAVAPPAGGWMDSFVPPVDAFKSAPEKHDACFNCHWKTEQPVRDNCAGCHKLAAVRYATVTTPVRISLKFSHEGGGEKKNHIAECTTCHINITKAASLRGLRPDGPITGFTECHNKEGLRQDLSKELAALDQNRTFACVYCHTSNVGKLDPPASHYLVAERPAIKPRGQER